MGNLAETPLPGLLLSLARDGFEGWLALERPGVQLRFRWRKGQPFELASSREEDSLRAVLTARGALAPAAAEAAAARMREKKASELQALASAGVPPKELVLALAATLERALVECLSWTNGSFNLQFEAAPGNAPVLPFSLAGLVYRAIASSWRSDQVLVALGPRATRFATVPADALPRLDARLAKLPAFLALLPRLDGTRTPFEALREVRHPEAHAALWLLDAQGLLAYADHRPSAAQTAPVASGPQIEIVVASASAAADAGRGVGGPGAKRDPAREAAARELAKEVAALHARLGELDYWQTLGVEPGASPGDVKRAYLKLAKRLHPDHLVRLGLAELKEKANEVFAQVSRAHEVLSDPEERARYQEAQTGVSETEALLAAQAEQYYQRGEMLIRAGNFRGALQLLERAVQTYEREADYHGLFAWALHRATPPDNARALQHFERAVELGGEQPQLLLRMSLVLRELGESARAGQLAQRARSLDAAVKA